MQVVFLFLAEMEFFMAVIGFRFIITSNFVIQFYTNLLNASFMKKLSLLVMILLTWSLATTAQNVKTYENKAFSIDYPADWEVTWDSETFVNLASADEVITLDVSYNEVGPKKTELQECVDNWVYMKESNGNKVDQKLVKDDYALVRSIATDENDGTQTVTVWFIMISKEPECFSGTINCPFERANDALDILVGMLATLSPK